MDTRWPPVSVRGGKAARRLFSACLCVQDQELQSSRTPCVAVTSLPTQGGRFVARVMAGVPGGRGGARAPCPRLAAPRRRQAAQAAGPIDRSGALARGVPSPARAGRRGANSQTDLLIPHTLRTPGGNQGKHCSEPGCPGGRGERGSLGLERRPRRSQNQRRRRLRVAHAHNLSLARAQHENSQLPPSRCLHLLVVITPIAGSAPAVEEQARQSPCRRPCAKLCARRARRSRAPSGARRSRTARLRSPRTSRATTPTCEFLFAVVRARRSSVVTRGQTDGGRPRSSARARCTAERSRLCGYFCAHRACVRVRAG